VKLPNQSLQTDAGVNRLWDDQRYFSLTRLNTSVL
jgi:hypothetical protein